MSSLAQQPLLLAGDQGVALEPDQPERLPLPLRGVGAVVQDALDLQEHHLRGAGGLGLGPSAIFPFAVAGPVVQVAESAVPGPRCVHCPPRSPHHRGGQRDVSISRPLPPLLQPLQPHHVRRLPNPYGIPDLHDGHWDSTGASCTG